MIETYMNWMAAIPVWKKFTFTLVSSFLTIIINFIMAFLFNITLKNYFSS